MGLKLIDVDAVKKWIVDLRNYDYSKLADGNENKMRLILTAKIEAYENILSLTN